MNSKMDSKKISSKKNNSQKQADPVEFACRFFKAHGAVLDSQGDLTNVLLPGELARFLEIEEFITITPNQGAPDQTGNNKVYPMQFQTPLLDRIASRAVAIPPFLNAVLKYDYIKSQGFERLIQEQFNLYKTKIKVTESGQAKTRYLILTCRYRAQSDELKEGLFDLCINQDTGAVIPDMPESISFVEKEYPLQSVEACTQAQIKQIHELVSCCAPELMEQILSVFIESMNRRFKRDAKSLDEYYTALEKEMREALSRSGMTDRLIREREEKIAMLPEELAAKKKDLLNKYGITVSIRPVAALALKSPCITVFAKLMSGRKKSRFSLTYNPATKKMDPLVCRSCGMTTYAIGCCKNMHLICAACLEKGCRQCSPAFASAICEHPV